MITIRAACMCRLHSADLLCGPDFSDFFKGGIPRTLPGWWLCWLGMGRGESSAVSQTGEQVVGESGNVEQRLLYLRPHRLCVWWLASLTIVKALQVRRMVYMPYREESGAPIILPGVQLPLLFAVAKQYWAHQTRSTTFWVLEFIFQMFNILLPPNSYNNQLYHNHTQLLKKIIKQQKTSWQTTHTVAPTIFTLKAHPGGTRGRRYHSKDYSLSQSIVAKKNLSYKHFSCRI